jgi:hypothetical protein
LISTDRFDLVTCIAIDCNNRLHNFRDDQTMPFIAASSEGHFCTVTG